MTCLPCRSSLVCGDLARRPWLSVGDPLQPGFAGSCRTLVARSILTEPVYGGSPVTSAVAVTRLIRWRMFMAWN
jgi:hypothetical protein